ncbi:MAG TPA: shikimate kinase [bacterium]|nr:shikimate kinase [bacterium]
MKGPVVLIGMMGSGKTSVGRELARLLGCPWTDLDHEIERRFKATVAEQFEAHGETEFRGRERDLLRELCAGGPLVLSAGGGVVLDPANRELLKARTCVFLDVPAGILAARLGGSQVRQRPLLRDAKDGAEAALRRLSEERGPLYRACATMTVDASKGTPLELAQGIRDRL